MWLQTVVSWIFDDALFVLGLLIILVMLLVMLFKLYLALRIRFGPPIEPGNPHMIKAFAFLVSEQGFSGPSVQQLASETHHTYTRDGVSVDPWHDTSASPFLDITAPGGNMYMITCDVIGLERPPRGFVARIYALAEYVKAHPELLEGDFRVVKGDEPPPKPRRTRKPR
jgi:hypothetical protein